MKLNEIKTDPQYNLFLNENDMLELFYSGGYDKLNENSQKIIIDKKLIDQYKKSADFFNFPNKLIFNETPAITIDRELHQKKQKEWLIDIKQDKEEMIRFLFEKCQTDIERARVIEELKLFDEKNCFEILYVLKYLVNHFRENNIVWGVGRGSSVASYCLYLLGVHKIDSIKFDIDIREFLR